MIFTKDTWPRDRWPNFPFEEVACSHCGACDINPGSMDRVQRLRWIVNHAISLTSGYRCPFHPDEVEKGIPGSHPMGCAFDWWVPSVRIYPAFPILFSLGFTGIGVALKAGKPEFLHIDDVSPGTTHLLRPLIWSY